MPQPAPQKLGCLFWQTLVLLLSSLICEVSQADGSLWVENPREVAFSVGRMTPGAQNLGLTDADFADTLSIMFDRVGYQARRSRGAHDKDVLFLDVIVDGETFYTSAGFWRIANYRLPNGDLNTEFVTVWQDYSVGAHHNDPETVRASVSRIIERFIAKYSDANKSRAPVQVASSP
jgi:hypothetical protein